MEYCRHRCRGGSCSGLGHWPSVVVALLVVGADWFAASAGRRANRIGIYADRISIYIAEGQVDRCAYQ